MTYRELLKALQEMPEERLDDTATVFEPYEGEYVALIDVAEVRGSDVLDDGHIVLNMKG